MYSLLVLVLISILSLGSGFLFDNENPEIKMNVEQILSYYGYPHEEHRVITEDGYILTLQRIPFGKQSKHRSNARPAVLLQHGLLDSAHTWINNPPGEGLAFILADAGFDVWLGNSRGNTYSKRHTYLSIHSKEFWSFSFDQMAKYDLPAMVQYIVQNTKQKKISYVGHSQGTMIGFAQFSQDPALSNMISSFSALGPVASVKNIGTIPRVTLTTINKLSYILEFARNGEFFPATELVKILAGKVCSHSSLTSICYNPIFWLAGFDIENMNISRVPIIVGHTPAGTSVQNLKHFYQLMNNGLFQMYDYGSINRNEYHYGQGTPPQYNVSQLSIPLAMVWGGQDILANPTDVRRLFPQVYKNVQMNKYIPYYNHMDYMWGLDSHRVFYPELVKFIRGNLYTF